VNAVTSSTGKSVLDIARQYGRADAEEVLASYGAAFAVTRRMDKQSDEEPDADYEVLDDDDDDDDESDTALDALEALVRRAREDPSYAPTVADIENLNAFPFDPFQSEAAEALIRGDCVVVSAPTGSGKTLVGEVAIVNALLRGQKAIYTTPLKALSNQKLREFQKIFGPRRVGLKTGDVEINAADADVVVMTTEILRNMLYPSAGAEDAGGGGVTVDVPSSAVVIGEDAGRADGRLEGVGVVILDEVHYLSDASRGTVWEETIIYLPSAVQLLCLSATVGNPDDLAGWIEDVHCRGGTQCEVVQSDYRPVPLTWHFSMKPGRMYPGLGPLLNRAGTRLHHELFPFTKEGAREWANANGGDGYGSYGNSFDDRYGVGDDDDGYYEGGFFRRNNNDRGRGRGGGGGRGRRGSGGGGGGGRRFPPPPPSPATDKQQRRRLVPHVETTVGQLVAGNMLPAVWFVFSRKGCDQAAEYLCRCGAKLVTPAEEREIAATLDAFARQNPDAIRDDAIEPLLLGIASHHAGLLPGWKGLVEGLFQRGLLKVVFATETLAAGVNMPARCSVLSALSKRGDAGPRMLTSNEFMQMCGRAGRRGFDTIGHVVACQSPFEGPEEAFDLVTSPPDNLRSQFSISYGMVLNLVRAGRPLPMVRSIVEQSFGNYLGGKAKREQTKELRRLKQQADALREQIEMGESIVPREEWRRYVKLEERLKEERRLMKIISRQSWDMKAEMARAAIRDFLEIDEGIALALVELDDVAEDGRVIRPGRNLPPSFSRGARPKSKTIGLMPDGSWSVEDPDAAEDDVADGEDDVASADSSNAVTPRTADAADAVAAFDDADSDESPHATPSSSSSTSSAFSRPRGRVALVAVVDAIAADSDGVGDFIGVDRDGAWYRFGAERARRVLNEPLVLAADVDAWPPRAPPVRSSIAWRRVGDGLWRAEGNADAIAAAAAAGVPRADDDSNSDDDESGASHTLVPIRPRWRGERRSLRTLPGTSLRPPHGFNTRPRRLSTPPDAFQLHPDFRLYRTALRDRRVGRRRRRRRRELRPGRDAALPDRAEGEGRGDAARDRRDEERRRASTRGEVEQPEEGKVVDARQADFAAGETRRRVRRRGLGGVSQGRGHPRGDGRARGPHTGGGARAGGGAGGDGGGGEGEGGGGRRRVFETERPRRRVRVRRRFLGAGRAVLAVRARRRARPRARRRRERGARGESGGVREEEEGRRRRAAASRDAPKDALALRCVLSHTGPHTTALAW
jgi:superfamily II RNA helicase